MLTIDFAGSHPAPPTVGALRSTVPAPRPEPSPYRLHRQSLREDHRWRNSQSVSCRANRCAVIPLQTPSLRRLRSCASQKDRGAGDSSRAVLPSLHPSSAPGSRGALPAPLATLRPLLSSTHSRVNLSSGGLAEARRGSTVGSMPLHTPPPKKTSFRTRTYDLTSPTAALLMQLSLDATDALGRAVSHSTVIRALLRYAEQQDVIWLHDQLFPLIEKEVMVGIPSGSKEIKDGQT